MRYYNYCLALIVVVLVISWLLVIVSCYSLYYSYEMYRFVCVSYYLTVCSYVIVFELVILILLLVIVNFFYIVYNSFNKFLTTLSFLYIYKLIINNFITNYYFFKSTDDDDCAYISRANIFPIVCGWDCFYNKLYCDCCCWDCCCCWLTTRDTLV